MYRDITEHKKIDQMKTDFITIASHQLRTPLTGVKWISELLLKGKVGRLNTEQREMVGHLIESNERMVVLVNDLLNVSRIEAGKMDVLESKQEDMIAFIHSIIEELTPVAAKKNVTIIFSSHPPQLEISFDAGKLRQAMVNVVSNAIKYSPEKSKVELGVKNTATAIVFSCQDQGIGIPPTEQGRLFEKFFRASNALKYQAEGSGLGLYITNSLVGLHGGKLWFESKEGQGTTFYISLPLKK
jgi:signal transduction histidine kinase